MTLETSLYMIAFVFVGSEILRIIIKLILYFRDRHKDDDMHYWF